MIYQTRLWSFVMMLNQLLSLGSYFYWFLCCEAGALRAEKNNVLAFKSPSLAAYSINGKFILGGIIDSTPAGWKFWNRNVSISYLRKKIRLAYHGAALCCSISDHRMCHKTTKRESKGRCVIRSKSVLMTIPAVVGTFFVLTDLPK